MPTIAERLRLQSAELTAAERKLMAALFSNYPMAGLASITEFAREADVSTPSVLRLAKKLGFSGFPAFQEELRAELSAQLQNPIAKQERWSTDAPDAHILNRFAVAAAENLSGSLRLLDHRVFDQVVGLLNDRKRRIHCGGGRITHAIAGYLAMHLQMARPHVSLIPSAASHWPQYALDLGKGDVVVLFDIRRYDARMLEFAASAKERGARIVLITDQWISPIARLAVHSLPLRIEAPSPWDSNMVPLFVAETLVAATVAASWPATQARIRELESLSTPDAAANDACDLRLHHRWRGLGRLRDGGPALGRRKEQRPAAGIRRQRPRPLHPDALGTVLSDEHEPLQLGLRNRSRAASGRPAPGHAAGKVVGGSSSINGMVYVRGHARDFDTWEEMGAKGWGFRHVQPYFKRMEHSHGGEDGWRGTNGPMHVTRGARSNPLYQAFIEAGRQAGYPVTQDYNGHQQEGFGPMEMTVHRGVRWSAANAYIRPALKRPNMKLETYALAHRILLDGRRAIGVEYDVAGELKQAHARRDVIIAASSINSPKLLQLSGIGAPETLKAAGIDMVHALPGVGENLQDHLEIYFQMKSKEPVTLHSKLNWFSKGMIGLEWMLFGTGLGATNHFESCGFIRSRAGIAYPDIQFHFLPAAMRYDGRAAFNNHGFQVHVGPMRSKSRGFVRIRSKDPRESPRILFNYLSHPDDLVEWRSCIRLTREIMVQPAMERYAGTEIQPGKDVETDDQIDAFIREHCESAYHPCGTCKMGSPQDSMAVVDAECRVIGIANLRVADSSIMPQVTNGNLNAPTLMIGEKASDHILGSDPLPPSNQEPWINPDWAVSQR